MNTTINTLESELVQQTSGHPNDKMVYIRRKKSFLETVQQAGASFFEDGRLSVGSYFASKNSPSIGSGLSINEQQLLLPAILNMSVEDRDFRKAVNSFYAEFFTPIPHGEEGLKLNIGLWASNDLPLSLDNMPLNLTDYLRYRHAKGHPHVAGSEAEAKANGNKMFYIYDPVISAAGRKSNASLQDQAMQEYLAIKESEDKVDKLLTLLGVDPVRLVALKKSEDPLTAKQVALREIATGQPAKFLAKKDVDNYEQRYTIQSLLNAGIWQELSGGIIIDPRNNSTIGVTVVEAIAWMKDSANNNKLVLYKTTLQEYLRKSRSKSWEQKKKVEEEQKADSETAAETDAETDAQ